MMVKGLQKANAVKEETGVFGQTPSDDKVSLTRMEFWICRSQVLEYFLTFLGFRPILYIEILGTVICPNNLPKICGSQRVWS